MLVIKAFKLQIMERKILSTMEFQIFYMKVILLTICCPNYSNFFIISEHILKSNLAFWWYKDGTRLAYISFDNSRVDQIPYMIYGAPNTSLFSSITSYNNEYPKVVHYPYPKPGKINPQVTIRVVDIGYNVVSNHKQITPPKEIAHK